MQYEPGSRVINVGKTEGGALCLVFGWIGCVGAGCKCVIRAH